MVCLFYDVSFTHYQCFPFQKGHTVNAHVCLQTHSTHVTAPSLNTSQNKAKYSPEMYESWGNLRERHHWGDPGADVRILRWIFRKWDVGVWTGLSWLRIATGGGLL
jgi:hypothetical protein